MSPHRILLLLAVVVFLAAAVFTSERTAETLPIFLAVVAAAVSLVASRGGAGDDLEPSSGPPCRDLGLGDTVDGTPTSGSSGRAVASPGNDR